MTRRRRRPDPIVRVRPAEGRDRLVAQQDRPTWLTLALDAIQRHRASALPLDKVLAELVRARRAGSRERRQAGDALFAWARLRTAAEGEIDRAVVAHGGVPPRRREQDHAALLVARAWGDATDDGPELDAGLPEFLRALVATARDGALPAPPPSLPPWLDARLRAELEDGEALIGALLTPAPLTLAIDRRHTSVDAVLDALAARGVRGTPSPLVDGAVRVDGRVALATLSDDVRPHVWPMDEGSQLVVRALAAAPGATVLDLCAGGGGKSRLLTALDARVVAVDVNRRRLVAARARVPDLLVVRARGERPPFPPGSFSAVLVDAPCSGTGTLRRAPDLAARLSPDVVDTYPPVQRALVDAALDVLAPGGTLVYATCSLLPAENEHVVDAVLGGRDDVEVFAVADAPASARGATATGAPIVRVRPDRHGTDGFFLAAFRRR